MGWFGDVVGTVVDPLHLFHGDQDVNSSIDDQIRANNMAMPTAPDPNALIPDRTAELDQRLNATGSPWLSFAKNNQNIAQQTAESSAASQSAAATASAKSQLASRGGLSSGAAERLSTAGMNQGLDAQSGIARQGLTNQAGLDVQGQEFNQKNAGLWDQMATGMDLNRAGIASNNYGNAMQAWAAQQTSNADLQNSKSKGSILNLWR